MRSAAIASPIGLRILPIHEDGPSAICFGILCFGDLSAHDPDNLT